MVIETIQQIVDLLIYNTIYVYNTVLIRCIKPNVNKICVLNNVNFLEILLRLLDSHF